MRFEVELDAMCPEELGRAAGVRVWVGEPTAVGGAVVTVASDDPSAVVRYAQANGWGEDPESAWEIMRGVRETMGLGPSLGEGVFYGTAEGFLRAVDRFMPTPGEFFGEGMGDPWARLALRMREARADLMREGEDDLAAAEAVARSLSALLG